MKKYKHLVWAVATKCEDGTWHAWTNTMDVSRPFVKQKLREDYPQHVGKSDVKIRRFQIVEVKPKPRKRKDPR